MKWINVQLELPKEGVPVLTFDPPRMMVDYLVKFEDIEPTIQRRFRPGLNLPMRTNLSVLPVTWRVIR
jgi:hypothetical protein